MRDSTRKSGEARSLNLTALVINGDLVKERRRESLREGKRVKGEAERGEDDEEGRGKRIGRCNMGFKSRDSKKDTSQHGVDRRRSNRNSRRERCRDPRKSEGAVRGKSRTRVIILEKLDGGKRGARVRM